MVLTERFLQYESNAIGFIENGATDKSYDRKKFEFDSEQILNLKVAKI